MISIAEQIYETLLLKVDYKCLEDEDSKADAISQIQAILEQQEPVGYVIQCKATNNSLAVLKSNFDDIEEYNRLEYCDRNDNLSDKYFIYAAPVQSKIEIDYDKLFDKLREYFIGTFMESSMILDADTLSDVLSEVVVDNNVDEVVGMLEKKKYILKTDLEYLTKLGTMHEAVSEIKDKIKFINELLSKLKGDK